MNMFIFLLLSVAHADAKFDKAERIRLSEEIKDSAKRERWKRVDALYRKILKLKHAEPSFRDHSTGAKSAYYIGDMLSALRRAKKAYAIQKDDSLKMWINAIQQTTAPVEIKISRSFKEDYTLTGGEDLAAPEDQDAFAFAQRYLTEVKKFKGLLPFGTYSIAGQSFTVEAVTFPDNLEELFTDHITISVAPPPAPALVSSMGPRASLGMAYTGAGTAITNQDLNPISFSGMGLRASLGWQLQLRFGFDLFAELDFRNMGALMGKKPQYRNEFGLTEDGTNFTGDNYWGVGLLSGISYPINDLHIFAGFSLSQGQAVVQWLDTKTSQDYQLVCIEEQRSFAVCESGNHLTEALLMKGSILSGGLALGAQYNLFSLTDTLQGGIFSALSMQSDTSRTYYWGQIGLSITPSRSTKQ